MRLRIFNLLVNQSPEIRTRYHKYHDQAIGARKVLSYFYLLWLNFAVHVLRLKQYRPKPDFLIYEEKRLLTAQSESEANRKEHPLLSADTLFSELMTYDVVSFDIFDTLILRAVEEPTDLFWFLGEKLEVMDMKRLRSLSEYEARIKQQKKEQNMEVNLEEIWAVLSEKIRLSPEEMQTELDLESELCFANPFMKEIWDRLIEAGKTVIVISDMYLPASFLTTLLEKNGFTGFKKLYLSNVYRKSKADGSLFRLALDELKETYGTEIRCVHIGDNPVSDRSMAEKNGFSAILYPRTNLKSPTFRPSNMSYLIGSAYRAMVSNHLYNGLASYSMEYEYGFIYGGLFVFGYCHFIHEYCRSNGIDLIVFLSRDGDILQKVYQLLYPDEKTEYAYWSRLPAVKLMAERDRNDFFRRFIYHKVNQGISIGDALDAMELEELKKKLDAGSAEKIKTKDPLTDKNAGLLKDYLIRQWDEVLTAYASQNRAASAYYSRMLSGISKCAMVDIGWAGSGALSLRYLAKHKWKFPCEVIGLLAGTNTPYNSEPDASEPFLQSGVLVSYLFSQSHNRDLLQKHDVNRDYNIFFELLLSSPEPKFVGFYEGKRERAGDVYDPDLNITYGFGDCDPNPDGIHEIRKGILDFAYSYKKLFKTFPYMYNISGRDAYAPVLAAAGSSEKYLKEIEKRFGIEPNIN